MSGFKYGVLTNQLVEVGVVDAAEMAGIVREIGFDCVQLGPTLPLDDTTLETFAREGVAVNDLIYCRNLLGGSEEARTEHRNNLMHRIDLAAEHGVGMVTTSAGYMSDSDADTHDRYEAIRPLPVSNIDAWAKAFEPILERAASKGIRIAFENCPLMRNWAINPLIWEQMFERLDAPHLGLVYDPSHLIWQMIEPVAPLKDFASRIFAIHAKDTIIDRQRLAQVGILGDFSWWRYAIPGTGELDWSTFLRTLKEIGSDAPIIIEHEDEHYAGTLKDVVRGLSLGLEHLRKCESALS